MPMERQLHVEFKIAKIIEVQSRMSLPRAGQNWEMLVKDIKFLFCSENKSGVCAAWSVWLATLDYIVETC